MLHAWRSTTIPLTTIVQRQRFPTLYRYTVFCAPFLCELAGEGLVEDGGFAGFSGGESLLGFFFCLIEFGEEALDIGDDLLLNLQRRERNFCFFRIHYSIRIYCCARGHRMELVVHKLTFVQIENIFWEK